MHMAVYEGGVNRGGTEGGPAVSKSLPLVRGWQGDQPSSTLWQVQVQLTAAAHV